MATAVGGVAARRHDEIQGVRLGRPLGSVSMDAATVESPEWTFRRLGRDRATWWSGPLALALAAGTLVRFGVGWNGALFAVAQIVLVALAGIDLATRRLPNVITVPATLGGLALRLAFERSQLVEVALAAGLAFGGFLAVSLVLRGGLGMGDVKLAGMLGALLGWAAFDALAVGIVVGGVVSLVLLGSNRAGLHTAIAYGPCLALGGVVGILALHPPPLA